MDIVTVFVVVLLLVSSDNLVRAYRACMYGKPRGTMGVVVYDLMVLIWALIFIAFTDDLERGIYWRALVWILSVAMFVLAHILDSTDPKQRPSDGA